MEADEYGAKQERSLSGNDIGKVVAALAAMSALVNVWDGTVTVSDDDGGHIAEIWYDGEAEMWLADFSRLGVSP